MSGFISINPVRAPEVASTGDSTQPGPAATTQPTNAAMHCSPPPLGVVRLESPYVTHARRSVWLSGRSTWPAARCRHPGPALRDCAVLPEELRGFSLCAEDHVSADVLISDTGCLSGRGSLI